MTKVENGNVKVENGNVMTKVETRGSLLGPFHLRPSNVLTMK